MDAYTVQQHVADWLNSGDIPGLDHVHPALPAATGINFADYGQGINRCQALVYVGDEEEVRRSTPGANPATGQPGRGYKLVTYQVTIAVCHRSGDPDWTAGDRALKRDVVGGITVMLRRDPSLGSSAAADPLFNSAGEGRQGIRREYLLPNVVDKQPARQQWAYVYFAVSAWVQA